MSAPEAAPTGCLSELRLDRWLAGEVAAAELAEIEAHVRGCRRCTTRRAARDEERRLFQQSAPPMTLSPGRRPAAQPAPASQRPWAHRRRTLGGAAVLVTALAAAGFLIIPGTRPQPPETIIAKGQQRWRFFVRDGVAGTVRAGGPQEQVHPGDQLGFAFSADALCDQRVAVLGRDASGKASVYFPYGGTEVIEPPASADGLIPYSIRLDETLGPETLYGLTCSEAVALGPLQAALAGSTPPAWPTTCQVETMLLEKKPRR